MLDHLGYLTDSISGTSEAFRSLGYLAGKTIHDSRQRASICMLTGESGPDIELVEPDEDNRSLRKLLSSSGVSPYHLCLKTTDIDAEYERMVEDGWTPLFEPVQAPALGGRRICYFWRREAGLIEIVE
jgi:methylmalonyl-CoA/ethylmalonyl-CoA epimerase